MTDSMPYHGLARLMTRTYHGEDLTELGQALIQRSIQPGTGAAEALLDLAVLLHLKGFHEMACEVQMQGLRQQQSFVLPAQQPTSIRLLALMVPGELNANTPLEFLVDHSDIELQQLFIGKELPFPAEIPEHDVAFVAVGESEASLPLLAALAQALQHWPRPVLNHPARIAALARDVLFRQLAQVDGLVLPPTGRASREELLAWSEGVPLKEFPDWHLTYPLIVRPVDSHAGKGLSRVNAVGEWATYLETRQEEWFFVSPFVDYSSADGSYRKYRIALVGGVPFAGHMAISDHWMVHYLNGGMTESVAKRAEEADFMAYFDTGFASRQGAVLADLSHRLGLDYVVLDCAEMRDGRLLVFEADSSAVIHAMDPIEQFPYKHPAMQRVFSAFRRLLEQARQRPAGLVS